jgi:hypothetical protein
MRYLKDYKIFESDRGWKEVNSSDYWTNSKRAEPFTKHESQLINDFADNHQLRAINWSFGSSIRLEKETNAVLQHVYGPHSVLWSITIVKSEDEWFWVFTNTINKVKSAEQEDYYKADQIDGLMNLLEFICLDLEKIYK